MNNSISLVTGYTPAELFLNFSASDEYKKNMEWPDQYQGVSWKQRYQLVMENIDRSHRNRKVDKSKKGRDLQVNDLVFIKQFPKSSAVEKKISKFFLKFLGPFVITRIHRNSAEVATIQGKPLGVQNFSNLKLFDCSETRRDELYKEGTCSGNLDENESEKG